jgi:hypothetical protein
MVQEHQGDVIIEMFQVGNAVKGNSHRCGDGYRGVDCRAPSINEEVLKRNAVNKLNYVLRKGGGNGPARA